MMAWLFVIGGLAALVIVAPGGVAQMALVWALFMAVFTVYFAGKWLLLRLIGKPREWDEL